MIHFISEGGAVKRYVCDSADEIINFPKVTAGSTVQVITTGDVYTIDEAGEWKLTSSLSVGGDTSNLATKDELKDKITISDVEAKMAEQEEYAISNVPAGTIVDMRDREIIIVCPENAEFKQQEVGEDGNPNMYYMTFTTYLPEGTVTFKEGDTGVLKDEILDKNTTGVGKDKYGRLYKNHWFALAMLSNGEWIYFGDKSNKDNKKGSYMGWSFVAEYYDEKGNVIDNSAIRINLATKDTYFQSESSTLLSLLNKVTELEAKVAKLENK